MYQTKPGFVHRKIADVDVLISIGGNVADFNGYITLNETCAFLWDLMAEPKSSEQLVQSLCSEYEVSYAEVLADVQELLTFLTERALVQEVEA